jgi:hypothetical protein
MAGKNWILWPGLVALSGFLPGPRAGAQTIIPSGVEAGAQPGVAAGSRTGHEDLRIVMIRHAEKPKKGDNLSCQGLNRSLELPALLQARFGIPAFTYIPALGLGDSTKHSRMFQTIIPFAVQYNLVLTSKFHEDDSAEIAGDILQKKGTVLIVWEHKRIPSIVRALGLKDDLLKWPDDDYDSIWVITFKHGTPLLARSAERLKPPAACPF